MFKLRRMSWAGCVWWVWETREVHAGVWCGVLRVGDNFEDIGVDLRIILK
jgi:hypothetical protein